jgi:HlyD family secretion protein
MIAIEGLFVSAPIDEVDAPAVQVGMKARISLDAFPGRFFAGHVSRIAPYVLEIEKQARTVEIEVDFVEAEDCAELLPGYSADAEIILDSRENTLRVPTEAILQGSRVLVVAEDRLLVERHVEIGLSNWKFTEILSGLEEGEQVVLTANRPGVNAGVLAEIEPGRAEASVP